MSVKKMPLLITLFGFLLFVQCSQPEIKEDQKVGSLASLYQVETGNPVSVMLTSYSTTLVANGLDQTRLRIALIDSLNREILSADDTVQIYVFGDGKVIAEDGSALPVATDTAGVEYSICRLENGLCQLQFVAGTSPDKVKLEAKSGKLWPGGHEIHTLPGDLVMKKPRPEQIIPTTLPIDRMIGADISFLPQLEDRGLKVKEDGEEKDAIKLLKEHGFNYIRLRIFVEPGNEKGYSPGKDYCGLDKTLVMAKRITDAGMKILLDFHYSDYWADPQQQFIPKRWLGLDFETLQDSVRTYTYDVLFAMKEQGTFPAMVQIGNEINHGILWPFGHISKPDQLAELLIAGAEGAKAVDPDLPVMMHIALGGQNDEAVFWLDNMIARNVPFDIIGLSYYPRWHGTLDDLQYNLNNLVERYKKPVNVVEYSNFKQEVHDIVFSLPNDMGKGACIWEPLGRFGNLIDGDGNVTEKITIYDDLNSKYLTEE